MKIRFFLFLAMILIVSACGNKSSHSDMELSITLNHSEAEYAKQADVKNDPYIKKLEELSGYKLNYVFLNHSDYNDQLSLRFASNELTDLMRTSSILSNAHAGAVDQGIFTELGPLLDQYGPNIKAKIPETAWKSPRVTKDGKIYGIPVLTGSIANNDRILFIRKDWLDALQMEVPETLDDWVNYFEAVKNNDMNGNGDSGDEYGFTMFENLAWSDMFFGSFGVNPSLWHLQDGQLIPDMIRPETKEAIAFYREMYQKGYVNPDLFTKPEPDFMATIRNSQSGSHAGAVYQYNPWYSQSAIESTFAAQADTAEYVMVAPPKGPRGERYLGAINEGIYFVWVIPSSSDQAEEAVKFLDWAWSSEEASDFFAYGIEGHNYTIENGEIQYDPESPANKEKMASQMYQLSLNPKEIGFNSRAVVELLPEGEKIVSGYELSDSIAMAHDSLYMPNLETLDRYPELAPWGELFKEMFAKVMTGQADMEAFDEFVSDWKARGGDQAIKEATEWYNSFHHP